jgi:hypothetical protein
MTAADEKIFSFENICDTILFPPEQDRSELVFDEIEEVQAIANNMMSEVVNKWKKNILIPFCKKHNVLFVRTEHYHKYTFLNIDGTMFNIKHKGAQYIEEQSCIDNVLMSDAICGQRVSWYLSSITPSDLNIK